MNSKLYKCLKNKQTIELIRIMGLKKIYESNDISHHNLFLE